jgi:molybdopterin biosynthesis enzyme MoaB
MAYIVDLTVILHRLFLSNGPVSARQVQLAVRDYAKGSSRSQIHEEIRNFVTVTQTQLVYQDKDIMMEKIIDLIKQNCIPTVVTVGGS